VRVRPTTLSSCNLFVIVLQLLLILAVFSASWNDQHNQRRSWKQGVILLSSDFKSCRQSLFVSVVDVDQLRDLTDESHNRVELMSMKIEAVCWHHCWVGCALVSRALNRLPLVLSLLIFAWYTQLGRVDLLDLLLPLRTSQWYGNYSLYNKYVSIVFKMICLFYIWVRWPDLTAPCPSYSLFNSRN